MNELSAPVQEKRLGEPDSIRSAEQNHHDGPSDLVDFLFVVTLRQPCYSLVFELEMIAILHAVAFRAFSEHHRLSGLHLGDEGDDIRIFSYHELVDFPEA